MQKVTLHSGIVVVGTPLKQSGNDITLTPSIMLLVNQPLKKKKYVYKECAPNGERDNNGNEKVTYHSHKYTEEVVRENTKVTIFESTIKSIEVI